MDKEKSAHPYDQDSLEEQQQEAELTQQELDEQAGQEPQPATVEPKEPFWRPYHDRIEERALKRSEGSERSRPLSFARESRNGRDEGGLGR